ncbi:uncharacterized protein PFL1_04440 [Pseudozyma flocculosa PF-1]|uniref:Phosphatidylglycerol/phosphatidylinositol transfer protein n=2 Tax=Pseudozyma flocculosa TaxID=84751 RepID=A0A5C3FCB0_9BASI|nr:uncharacterized protein PFL1_04440 [Pseudozyma flocculosa PF-1]EPQ28113.1 hypothetical protein PFL1_04440 [Pseudozyma flocculosa PF-1]SPO41910.1 related to phosphatidylglycerol/phosphatidylinositol transfer protein [Pseudozyma flocculosa]
MRAATTLAAASIGLLAVATTHAAAWGCIGNDCDTANQLGQQIAFSAPAPDNAPAKLVPPPPGGAWTWQSCGAGGEIVDVQSIEVSPDPPKPGQNLTVRAKGTISEEVSDGTFADVVVKLGLIKLLTRRFDVCQEARANKAELQCPLAPGEYELTHTVALPREIPPAKFNVHITGANQDESDLLCLDLSINFMHR